MDIIVTEINTTLSIIVSGLVKNTNDRFYSAVLFSLYINIHHISINISVPHHTSTADRKIMLLVYICEGFSLHIPHSPIDLYDLLYNTRLNFRYPRVTYIFV
jgi:hypothetical protein